MTAKELTRQPLIPNKRPLLLGHRGARSNKSFLENTFASFDQALDDGCDGFEFDVRMTADGEAVICHDANVGSIEIAKNKGSALAHLPRLEDTLARYRRCAFLDIEVKVAGLERTISELLSRYQIERGFVVSSFLPQVLRDLHAADPQIPLGLICESRTQLERWRELPLSYVIVHYRLAAERLISEAHVAGKKVLVWTVNNETRAKKLAEWGVDGIISDDTRMLKRTFGASKREKQRT